MDMSFTYSYSQPSNFVDLLNSQQETPLDDSFGSFEQVFSQSTPQERRERRPWTPSDDVLLISSWLNTSKDPVVGNEQKGGAFWKRIAAYYAASPKAASREHREARHCKQRWHKINDLVCKFCGAYESATREKASGQNENDVLKFAHQIFFNDHKKKFTLEHTWKELRNDQKWCELSQTKTDASSKRRRSEEGSQPPGSRAEEMKSGEDDLSSNRPPGVQAAKVRGKREKAEGNTLSDFQRMWEIKEKDLAMKERLSKMGLLDSLIAKKEPLSEIEEALKKEAYYRHVG